MADQEDPDAAIIPEGTAQVEGADAAPATAETGAATHKPRFKSQDEAEKAHEEAERRMHAATQEAAKLREENQRFQAEALAKLVDAQAKKDAGPGASKQDIEARRQELKKRLDAAEDSEPVIQLVEDMYAETREMNKRDLKAYEEKLQALEASVQEMRETSSPEYQKDREKIEKVMKEAGVNRAQAIKIVKVLGGSAPDIGVSRESSPGSMGAGSRRPVANSYKGMTPSEIAEFKTINPDATDEEIAELQKSYSGRRN